MELNPKTKDGTVNKINCGSLMDVLDTNQKEPTFFKLWAQCCEDAEKSKREPLLIFRRTKKSLVSLCILMFGTIEKRLL
jgi:hypothetical protein